MHITVLSSYLRPHSLLDIIEYKLGINMTKISIKNLTVEFKIYDSSSRSLKRKILSQVTGGRIVKTADNDICIKALNNISLEIKDGDRIGLTGANGSGKTTFLRTLAGIYKPNQGSIEIEGDVSAILDPTSGMDPEATGYENIYLRGYILGMNKREIATKIDEIANIAQIGPFLNFPMKTYSAGMFARLAFAISVIKKPEILLMDEGIGAGDAAFQKTINQKIQELYGAAKILLIASHSTALLSEYCNKTFTFSQGKIIH